MASARSHEKEPSAYSAFVFDLDGTLFSIPIDWNSIRIELTRMIGEPDRKVPLFVGIQRTLEEKPSIRSEIYSMLDAHELASLKGAKLLEGAAELLSYLSGRGYLALVTLQGRALVQGILGTHGFGTTFGTIVTREDTLDRGDQLLIAVSKMGSPITRTLFVGDRDSDVIAGKKVGVDVAIVGGRNKSIQRAEYDFTNLLALRKFLTTFLGIAS